MNRNRLVMSTAIAAGLIFLITIPRQARAIGASPSALQIPTTATMAGQQGPSAAASDDFAGLDLTAEQKTEMDKIHQDVEGHKALVAKDTKLSNDQKDAFILGYSRLEYGQMFKVLTPAQQKSVRKKMRDRRAADQTSHLKQSKPPQK